MKDCMNKRGHNYDYKFDWVYKKNGYSIDESDYADAVPIKVIEPEVINPNLLVTKRKMVGRKYKSTMLVLPDPEPKENIPNNENIRPVSVFEYKKEYIQGSVSPPQRLTSKANALPLVS